MRRRQVICGLAVLSSGSIAGCVGGGFNKHTHFTLEATDLSSLASEVTKTRGFGAQQYDAIERSAQDGVAITLDSIESPYVRAFGSYYRVEDVPSIVEIDGRRYPAPELNWPILRVEPVDDATDAVSLDTYDEEVATFVASVADPSEVRKRPFPTDITETDQLTPEPAHSVVNYDGQSYRLGTSTRTTKAVTEMVRTVRVADSTGEFETYLREDVLDIDPLSPDMFTAEQRKILKRAIDFRYEEEGEVSDNFQTVLDTVFRSGDWVIAEDLSGVFGDGGQKAVVIYDSEMYVAETDKKTLVSEF